MHGQIDTWVVWILSGVSAFITFAFDVPAPAIFAAFVGSSFGVAFSDSVSYQKAFWMLIGGTIAAGMMVSMFIHYFGDYPPRPVAALLAFVMVKYREKILAIIGFQLDKFGGDNGSKSE